MIRALITLALVFACAGTRAWEPAHWFDKPKSARIANYRMEAVLDWPGKVIEGKGELTWRNTGTGAVTELPLHLYLNAFKGPQSLVSRGWTKRTQDPSVLGSCTLTSVEMDGTRLEGHVGADETVYWVRLARPVHPGETLRLNMVWTTRFPKVTMRSGWGGSFLLAAQWYPKVGVRSGNRWVCEPYHASTEFFADFGTYDVQISLPNALSVACTGSPVPQAFRDTAGGIQMMDARPDPKRALNHIWELHAEDVHDFVIAVSPRSDWTFEKTRCRGVDVYYYYLPSSASLLPRMRTAVEGAMKAADEWHFMYPYPVLTVLEVPDEARGATGMEYPTLFTVSSRAFDPLLRRDIPEEMAIHEFGHQIFHGVVANNEVDEAWLDEGLTSWFTYRTMERMYQSMIPNRRFHYGTDFGSWQLYASLPQRDPISRLSWQVPLGRPYDIHAYSKPMLVFKQLEAMLGQAVLEEALRVYAVEQAFKHPTAQDLRKTLEKVSGRNLGDFWRDFVDGTEVLDYVIQDVAPGNTGAVTLRRRGGIKVPITLWVRLSDRREVRKVWDGQADTVVLTFDGRVDAAVLDPDGNHPMLMDRLHATYARQGGRRGFHYWSQLLWGGLTALLQGVGLG